MDTANKQTNESNVSTPVTQWNIDNVHTGVRFSVRHMVVTEVAGRFKDFTGTIRQTGNNFVNAAIDVHIATASVTTDNDMRDNHLRSADFFEAEKYPEITFRSASIEKTGNDEYRILGDLTIHGITKQVTLTSEYNGEVIASDKKRHIGFSASGTLNRADYGLVYNMLLEAGGVAISDKIKLHIDVEAIEAEPAAALPSN